MSESASVQIRRLTEYAESEQGVLEYLVRRWLNKPDRSVVEDVLSESYFIAAEKLLREPDLEVKNMGAWFKKVIYYQCLKQRSKKQEVELSLLEIDDLEIEEEFLDELYQGARVDLDQALQELEEHEVTILKMYSEGYTSTEIANKTGYDASSVRRIKKRVIAELRKALK